MKSKLSFLLFALFLTSLLGQSLYSVGIIEKFENAEKNVTYEVDWVNKQIATMVDDIAIMKKDLAAIQKQIAVAVDDVAAMKASLVIVKQYIGDGPFSILWMFRVLFAFVAFCIIFFLIAKLCRYSRIWRRKNYSK